MKRENKGITLIALVIIVTVLIILASIATYSGVGIIRQSKLNKFTTEMKVMQTEINALYDRYTSGETDLVNLGKELDSQADKVFTSGESGITDKTGYRYYDQATIQSLGIEDIEEEFFVNIQKRSVVSYLGLEYEGITYYTLDKLPQGLYNVEYENRNTEKPTFEISKEQLDDNRWKITVYNIQYSGYIDKWQVKYQKEGQDYWSTSEDLEFIITDLGKYNIKIVNGDVVSDTKSFETKYILADFIENAANKNITAEDNLGNKVKIPKGFKVVVPDGVNIEDYDVENGIVVEDVTYGATAGSQFVWIPVGENIKRKDGTIFAIKLSRYTFDSSGTPTDQGSKVIENHFQELNKGRGNTTAKENIESEEEGFRKSAIENGGYYIGRYEARTSATTQRTADTDDSALTQITERPNDYVYTWVTQPQAAKLSQEMYKGVDFTSDLMNSYAWDTAIVFLQECDDREGTDNKPYSQQTSLNYPNFASKGTNNENAKDVICNIYDMASNCYEDSTETSDYSDSSEYPFSSRGGIYNDQTHCTSYRLFGRMPPSGSSYISFRPILYL